MHINNFQLLYVRANIRQEKAIFRISKILHSNYRSWFFVVRIKFESLTFWNILWKVLKTLFFFYIFKNVKIYVQ
jgi:hypothetical protein